MPVESPGTGNPGGLDDKRPVPRVAALPRPFNTLKCESEETQLQGATFHPIVHVYRENGRMATDETITQ